jgi:hypothetical protein
MATAVPHLPVESINWPPTTIKHKTRSKHGHQRRLLVIVNNSKSAHARWGF